MLRDLATRQKVVRRDIKGIYHELADLREISSKIKSLIRIEQPIQIRRELGRTRGKLNKVTKYKIQELDNLRGEEDKLLYELHNWR